MKKDGDLGIVSIRRKVTNYLNSDKIDVLIDGNTVASLSEGESIDIPVETGKHKIRLYKNTPISDKFQFQVRKNETIYFECFQDFRWYQNIKIILDEMGYTYPFKIQEIQED